MSECNTVMASFASDRSPLLGETEPSLSGYLGMEDCDPETGSFLNAQGLRLATYFYPALTKKPRGAILLVHGYGCHWHWEFTSFPNNTYKNSWIESFNETGLNVYGFDLQSHGLSEGLKGYRAHVNRFQDFTNDTKQFYYHCKAKEKGGKVYVLGLSMGGCIVSHVAEQLSEDLDGLILAAPMLRLERIKRKPANKVLLPFSACISACWPSLPVGSKSKNPFHPDIGAEHDADPLNYDGRVRARMATEFFWAVDKAIEDAHKVSCPHLVIHSEEDTMTDPEGSQMFYDGTPSGANKKLAWVTHLGFWHGLSKEPQHEKIAELIVEWLAGLLVRNPKALGKGKGERGKKKQQTKRAKTPSSRRKRTPPKNLK